jgi:hypothetical protein
MSTGGEEKRRLLGDKDYNISQASHKEDRRSEN